MALIGNYSVLTKSPGRWLGGPTVSGERSNWNRSSSSRAMYFGWAARDPKTPVPNGYRPGRGAWVVQYKGGNMSAHVGLLGEGTVNAANLAGGKNATATLSGTGIILSANLGLIVSATATLNGTGEIVNAALVGQLAAAATLTGTGTLTAADLKAVGHMTAALSGTGTLAAATLTALGHLAATITTETTLSPGALARAVWAEPQAEYVTAGTFGANLDAPVSSIGGGSLTEEGIADAVWDEALTDHSTAGSTGAFMQKLLTVARFLGLK